MASPALGLLGPLLCPVWRAGTGARDRLPPSFPALLGRPAATRENPRRRARLTGAMVERDSTPACGRPVSESGTAPSVAQLGPRPRWRPTAPGFQQFPIGEKISHARGHAVSGLCSQNFSALGEGEPLRGRPRTYGRAQPRACAQTCRRGRSFPPKKYLKKSTVFPSLSDPGSAAPAHGRARVMRQEMALGYHTRPGPPCGGFPSFSPYPALKLYILTSKILWGRYSIVPLTVPLNGGQR